MTNLSFHPATATLQSHAAPPVIVLYPPTPGRPPKKEGKVRKKRKRERTERTEREKGKERKKRKLEEQRKGAFLSPSTASILGFKAYQFDRS